MENLPEILLECFMEIIKPENEMTTWSLCLLLDIYKFLKKYLSSIPPWIGQNVQLIRINLKMLPTLTFKLYY